MVLSSVASPVPVPVQYLLPVAPRLVESGDDLSSHPSQDISLASPFGSMMLNACSRIEKVGIDMTCLSIAVKVEAFPVDSASKASGVLCDERGRMVCDTSVTNNKMPNRDS
jgi:ABC-type glucose/galactose transport system permease subunit